MTTVVDGNQPPSQASQPPLAGAAPASLPAGLDVSVVVPTYHERENLPALINRIESVARVSRLDLELLIMDDNSQDGTEELIAQLNKPWVRLIVRKANRGLSPAVMDGLRAARHARVVVMDADLSHPPEAIPAMLAELERGQEFVVGSRYVAGGSTDAAWGFLRWLNSKVATLMARPLTSLRDPMAGFFALRRADAQNVHLNPVGYKIGLELLIKCGFTRVTEIPIHFTDRTLGQSKLNLKEQLRYIQHLRRLFLHKYPDRSHLIQFIVVGLCGLGVNLGVLTLLLAMKMGLRPAAATAIGVSMLFNFALNRRFTFSYARRGRISRQLPAFVLACSAGAVINYFVTIAVALRLPADMFAGEQLAAFLGVVAGTGSNYLFNRYIVFHKRHHRHG
ncbi:MAG: glycosyltransferase family 2 protein [Phycisphaeraceae bacterium]|nr:glycosyltransferase family 2 protein [Phycisphaeraceae bacterium]